MNRSFRTLLWSFNGTMLGMIAVAVCIGARIGWEQSTQWPAWLAVPLGAGMGPFYIVIDLMELAHGRGQALIVLPQSLAGGCIGGLLAFALSRRRA